MSSLLWLSSRAERAVCHMRPHAKVRQSMTLHPGSHGLPLIKKPPCRTFFPLPLSRLAAAAGCVCWPAAAGPVHGAHVARSPWVVGHPVAPPCCCNMVGTSSCFWSGAHATRSALPAHSSPPLSACHQATPPGRQLHNHSSSSSCCPPLCWTCATRCRAYGCRKVRVHAVISDGLYLHGRAQELVGEGGRGDGQCSRDGVR